MAAKLPREPFGSAKESKPRPRSAASSARTAGEPAIVFPLIRDRRTTVKEAPLVCLNCCLEVRDRL
jgi:hypothetical protein